LSQDRAEKGGGTTQAGAPAAAGQSRRKAETQQRIVQAAMELFLRRGFERTSITQIAAKAGVSRAAVFWHFGDKLTLFHEAGRRFLVPLREALGGRLSHLEPRKRLFELFSAYERFVADNAERVRAFVRWALDSPADVAVLRDDLLALHDTYRAEIEGALAELVGDAREAAALADGLLSLLDGNLLLGIFGAPTGNAARRQKGLRAITEAILRELPER
jgi:AcrR family transcriptional regulator